MKPLPNTSNLFLCILENFHYANKQYNDSALKSGHFHHTDNAYTWNMKYHMCCKPYALLKISCSFFYFYFSFPISNIYFLKFFSSIFEWFLLAHNIYSSVLIHSPGDAIHYRNWIQSNSSFSFIIIFVIFLPIQVGVKITLASTGLTKICTFTPYYLITNKAKVSLPLTFIRAPLHLEPFFPSSPFAAAKTLLSQCGWTFHQASVFHSGQRRPPRPWQWCARSRTRLRRASHSSSRRATPPSFSLTTRWPLSADPCSLPLHLFIPVLLPLQYGGINVETQVMESAVHIQLDQYKEGLAAVMLVNHTTKANIAFGQVWVSGLKSLDGLCLVNLWCCSSIQWCEGGEEALVSWRDSALHLAGSSRQTRTDLDSRWQE